MSCRDWTQTLRLASYKGQQFYVDSYDHEGGGRLVTHEFANRDESITEHLGAKTPKFSVKGYFAGDLADFLASAFYQACQQSTSGTLTLPISDPVLVFCEEVSYSFSKDRMGYVELSLKFVQDFNSAFGIGLPLLTSSYVPFIPAQVQALANQLRTIGGVVQVATTLAIQRFAAVPGAMRTSTATVASVTTFAAVMQRTVDRVTLVTDNASVDPILAPRGQTSLDLSTAIGALVRAGDDGVTRAAEPLTSAAVSDGTGLVDRAFFIAETIANHAASSDDAYREFLMVFDDLAHVSPAWLALTDAEVDALPSFEKARIQTRRAPSALREDRTIRQLSSVFRTAVLTAAAIAVADMQLDTRRDGIRVRADMAERFDELLAEVDDPDHAEAIREVQGLVSDYVSQRNISLAPIGTVEAQESLPVLHWAYQLYENPNRARELVALNTIQSPDRMPTRFEARKL